MLRTLIILLWKRELKRFANLFSFVIAPAASGKGSLTYAKDLGSKYHDRLVAQSAVQLHFEGDFNPMMAMMIKGPISKFIETLAENMHKL